MYLKDFDVNAEMVRQGMAWVYRYYLRDKALLDVEKEAKAAKRGLWADPNPIPPWEWRKQQRAKRKAKKARGTAQKITVLFSCDVKKNCKQMNSCEEARFYLTQCGRKRLDGDKDGIPCESICKK